jgi:tRNA pseudouridine55 synthase
VELEPRLIQVHSLDLLEWALPDVVVDVHCSSGTYVRSLANDIGEQLGVGAHLTGLRRSKSGHFTLKDAVSMRQLRDDFENSTWANSLIPSAEALGEWPTIELDEKQLKLVVNGNRIPAEASMPELSRAISEQGELVAILKKDGEEWQPKKVFFQS